jgi:hypothetical protein
MGKMLIIIGVFLIITGVLIAYKVSVPFLDKLPGDIIITGDKFQFYFPLVSYIIVSVILSLLFYLFGR